MRAIDIMAQNNGDVTKSYYAELAKAGWLGELGVALFRAQKRSMAAKSYGRSRYRGAAYDVKNWSMSEVCRLLGQQQQIRYGWKEDPNTPGYSWVLYVDLPQGQVSFHSPTRMAGPDYPGDWDGQKLSADRIMEFCDMVWRARTQPPIERDVTFKHQPAGEAI